MDRTLTLLTLSLALFACNDPEEPGDGSSSGAASTSTSADPTTTDPTTTAGPMPTTMPTTMPMPAACEGDGALGACCDASHPCTAPALCGPLLGADAALLGETCNVCLTAADCAMGLLCAPVIDPDAMMMMGVSGKRDCVAPGSLADDAMCPDDDTGDAACMSGHCGTVDVMGLLTLHLCGACEADADCDADQVCQPAAFDMTLGPTGARCV